MSSSHAQRILICFHDFSKGGTERIAIGMAAAWAKAGRDVTILCGTEEGGVRDTVDPSIRVVSLDPPVRRSPFSRLRLGREMAKRLEELKPDIIFLPGNFHVFLANNLKKSRACPPIVMKISNPPVPEGNASGIARRVFTHFAQGVDAFAGMNRGLTTDLIRLLPRKHIATLFDPIYTNTNAKRADRKHGAPLNILWAGRLEPQKDVPLALATIKELNLMTPAHLVLLGDGAQSSRLPLMIEKADVADLVTAKGYVPSIDPFLPDADALLITSHYEGGPAVAVEALAAGVPVVSTDCSHFLREIITNAKAGRILPRRNAEALAGALLSLSQAPRPRAEQFHSLIAHLAPEKCATAYLEWLDWVASNESRTNAPPSTRR